MGSGHTGGIMPGRWTQLRAAVDPITRQLGFYTAYALDVEEHVGSVELTTGEAQQYLRQRAYDPQYLSAAKRHPETGELHKLSTRHVPDDHPPAADGTQLAERYAPRECQFHTHWFDTAGGVDVFSHYETRPDLLRPEPSIERLRTHYRPERGSTYLRGITNLEL